VRAVHYRGRNATEREGRLRQWRPEQPERPQVPHFARCHQGLTCCRLQS